MCSGPGDLQSAPHMGLHVPWVVGLSLPLGPIWLVCSRAAPSGYRERFGPQLTHILATTSDFQEI